MLSKIVRLLKNPDKLWLTLDYHGFFRTMSDEKNIKIKYRIRFGKEPNLENPKTFNEKLQWMKLHDRKPEYTMMVDKYRVRDYVREKMGEECLIPLYGMWEKAEDIDFDSLPDQFVLKGNHDSGSVVICRDKSKLDREKTVAKMKKALKRNGFWFGREWPYKNVKPCIIAEALMQDEHQIRSLKDYKFYCFHGEPKFLYISEGLEQHSTANITFLNLDWTFAPFQRADYAHLEELPVKPINYDRMVSVARELSQGIPFLRVDLYEIGGKLYFSELTFTPCSGMTPFTPPEWDEKLGEMLSVPKTEK